MKNYPHLAARLFNVPLLVHPQKLDAIIAGLGSRLLGVEEGRIVFDASAATPELFSTRKGEKNQTRGYRVVDGVAVVGVSGALVHRSRMEANSSFLLGYNDIAADVEDAMANADVHAVLLNFDSPGGEVQGAFELAQRVFEQRGKKPIKAIADGMAASAAYLGGSATDELVITRTGYAGSIGVVMRHVDFSRSLANEGINVTHIYAGAHKVDGNQFEPLPEAVRADLQAEINDLYQMFIDAVATQRRISPDAIRATEAKTYRGVAAVAAGLADRLGTTDQLIAELAALRSSRSYGLPAQASATKGASMSTTDPAGSTQQPATVFTQADLDRVLAEGRAAGATEGAATERARVSAIQAHPEAVGRTALATMCIAQGLSAEQAGALLAAAPKDQPTAAANPFAAAMGGVPNPLTKPDAAQSENAAEASSTLVTNMVSLFQGSRK